MKAIKSIFRFVLALALAAVAMTAGRVKAESDTPPLQPIPSVRIDTKDSKQAVKENQKRHQDFIDAVTKMEAHMTVVDGAIIMDGVTALDLNIDQALFDELSSSLAKTNSLVKSGEVRIEQVNLNRTSKPVVITGKQINQVSACAGVNAYAVYWWGVQIWLNECLTQFLINSIWVGSGAAGVCTAIAAAVGASGVGAVVAVICGIVAGGFAMGAGALGAIDGLGGNHGLVIGRYWTGGGWFWHQ